MNHSLNDVRCVLGRDATLTVVGGPDFSVKYNDARKFVSDIPKLFKNVKYVSLTIFHCKFAGYITNLDFCEAVKAKLDAFQKNYCFNISLNSLASSLMVLGNVTVKPQELVHIYEVMDDKTVIFSVFKFTDNGYKNVGDKKFTPDIKKNPNLIREKVMALSNLKKIILVSKLFPINDNTPLVNFMKAALKSDKLVDLNDHGYKYQIYMKELLKWFTDKSYTKFHILPSCARNYFLVANFGKVSFSLLNLYIHEPLPYTKSFLLPNLTEKVTYGYEEDEASFRTIPLKEKCHEYRVTFSVDVNNLLEVQYQSIVYAQVIDLPKKLDNSLDKKIPVIAIFDEISVINVQKNNKYKFLNTWNGMYGKELIISFAEEKPKFFLPQLREYEKFVVYDLIKIMSMTIDGINKANEWSFAITKDADNPILLEFDYFNGERKAASPAFLMALLFKEHLKAIKKEMGQKPKEIGICLLQKFKEEDEKTRIEEQLTEACTLLDIGCVFVNV